MVNDNPLEHKDTLPELSDAWECLFKLCSQIQSVESGIHIRQLALLGLKSGSHSSVRLRELEQEICSRQASLARLLVGPSNRVLLSKTSFPSVLLLIEVQDGPQTTNHLIRRE